MNIIAKTDRIIAVIGLGYVGLPVAVSFASAGYEVIGFDIDNDRISELKNNHDRTNEIDIGNINHTTLCYSCDVSDIKNANFFIITVPTPIDCANRPDLSALFSASKTVGQALNKGDIVVYESTVYPGATEDECLPILEKLSGLQVGVDFKIGYSPERINPGDKQHRFENIKKVVSANDDEALEIITQTYGSVVHAGIHQAPTIMTAEAAKVIENTQRDLNIAFMNELSLIFSKLGIDTNAVLEAAATKWNFLPFTPGLVGGHCIGVDPYYLTYKAEMLGYQPDVILSGRRVNDGMGAHIAMQAIRHIVKNKIIDANIVILGLTFKENVPDIRNSKVVDIISKLLDFGVNVQIHDPLACPIEALNQFNISLAKMDNLKPADILIIAVPHQEYKENGWPAVLAMLNGTSSMVMDIKAMLDCKYKPDNLLLWRL